MQKIFLNTKEAAGFLDVSPLTLIKWRSTKRYNLPYRKIGGKIRYHIEDLKHFVDSSLIKSIEMDF